MSPESFLFTRGGRDFHALKWPISDPQAVVCIVHGHGEHIGRYEHVASYLNERSIACFGFDFCGHGKTDSKRGHWPSYDSVLDSLEECLRQAIQPMATPVFLFGHSMGGNVAANFALRRNHKLRGLVLSSPWFRLSETPSKLDLILATVMLRVYPSFTQSTKTDPRSISRDPQEVAQYIADPLVHDRISPVMFTSLRDAGEWALKHAHELELPLLAYHGDADQLTSFEASREFAIQAGGTDVTFQAFEGGFHELHREPEPTRSIVLKTVADWITERIGPGRNSLSAILP